MRYTRRKIAGSLVVLSLAGTYFFPYQFVTPAPHILYDVTGKVIVGHKQEPWREVDEIPVQLRELVVGVEDRRFRRHPGIDPLAVIRALWLGAQGVRPRQGASTIEQQLIKLDCGAYTRIWRAKLQENRGALTLQRRFSKEELLLRYLNISPFSHSIVGWNAACKAYRGQSCATADRAHLLFLLVTTQLGANPYREDEFKKIMNRAQMYVRTMPSLFSGVQLDETVLFDDLRSFPAPLDARVQTFLQDTLTGGVTSYDLELSSSVDTILERTTTQRDQYNIQDCCVVVLDGDGALVSMNMCRKRDDLQGGKVNTCLVPRQTGSAIKPFLYLYAFKKLGRTQQDTIIDEPIQFDLGGGNLYDPKNFDLTYHGEVSYAYALGNSLNVPAVKTLHEVGVSPFLDFLKQHLSRLAPQLTVNPKPADEVGLSLALGTYEMSPLQFAQLWRLFLPRRTPAGYEAQRKDIVDILTNPLHKMVSFGQDTFLATPGRAVKTGTSRKFVDGRICGVNQGGKDRNGAYDAPGEIRGRVVCIRLGNQTNEPMLGASSEVGSYLRSLVVNAVENRRD